VRMELTVHVFGIDRSDRRKRENDNDESSPENCDSVDDPTESTSSEMERSRLEHDLCKQKTDQLRFRD